MRASLTELTVNVIEQLAMDCNTCKLQKPNSITFLMKIFFSPLFIQINIKKNDAKLWQWHLRILDALFV